MSVKVDEIETDKPEEKPGITCSDGTPTGELSSGVEQDGQPESILIDLMNSGDDEMQTPWKKVKTY